MKEMAMTWHIDETLDLIENKFGKHQRELANASIQSANQRLRYAQFHYCEIRNLLEQFKATHLNKRPAILLVWGQDEDARSEYFDFMDKVGAHAVACVQSIHAIADLLANAVFRSLALDAGAKPVPEHKVDCALVLNALKKEPRFASIERNLEVLTTDRAFVHVAALTNKAKHSNIVKSLLNEDMTGQRAVKHEIRFDAFERKDVSYPQATLDDVLAPAYAVASKAIVDIGNGLTKVLE